MENTYIGNKISELRKEHKMTQDQLAERLGISYQAVSKWENNNACPDIMIIPMIADIFGVTIDTLFREQSTNVNEDGYIEVAESLKHTSKQSLPWQDDNKLRAVVYEGHKFLQHVDETTTKLRIIVEGTLNNLESQLSVECQDVAGNAYAGNNMTCQDVGSNVNAGNDVVCSDISGNVNAGSSVECSDVNGNIHAGNSVNCADVHGYVVAGNEATGNVKD